MKVMKEVRDALVEMRMPKPQSQFDALVDQFDNYSSKVKVVTLAPGIVLDPDRPIAAAWKKTPYTHLRSYNYDVQKGETEHERTNVGHGFGVIPHGGGIYKVRHLVRPTLGQVENLHPFDYETARRATVHSPLEYARYEPVPDDVPECPPIFPAWMPTCYRKAVGIAAKALKKPEDSLSFEEVLEYFRKNPPKAAVFKV